MPLIKITSKPKIKICSLNELRWGDICVYENELDFVAHRFLGQKNIDGIRYILCKGDANIWFDNWISEKRLLGKITCVRNNGSEINIETRLGYTKSLSIFLFSFLCNLFRFFMHLLKRILVWLVVRLGKFSVFKSLFALIYKTAAKTAVSILRKKENVTAIYLKGSFITDLWVPGLSDIDFIVDLDRIDDKILTEINYAYKFLKNWIPLLGELFIYESGYISHDANRKLIYSSFKAKPQEKCTRRNSPDVLFKSIEKIIFTYSRLINHIVIFSSTPKGDLKAFRNVLFTFRNFHGTITKHINKESNLYHNPAKAGLDCLMDTIAKTSIYEYRQGRPLLAEIYRNSLYYIDGLTHRLKETMGKEFEDIIHTLSNSIKHYNIKEFDLDKEFYYLEVDKLLINATGANVDFYFKCGCLKKGRDKIQENLVSFLKALNGRRFFICTDNSIVMQFISSMERPFDIFRLCQCHQKMMLDAKFENNGLWKKMRAELLKSSLTYQMGKLSSFATITQINSEILLEDIYNDILTFKLYRETGLVPFSFKEALDIIDSHYKDSNFCKNVLSRFDESTFNTKNEQDILNVHFKNYLFMYNLLQEEKMRLT